MKIKSLIKHNLMRAAMTLALILACATAWAQTTQSVTYIDENGQPQTVNATHITSDNFRMGSDRWYYVSGTVGSDSDYLYLLTENGTHNLILCDGATLTVFRVNQFSEKYAKLKVYGQSGGTGKLNVGNGNVVKAIYNCDLALYGGEVTLTYLSAWGYGTDKNVDFNGGKLTATSGANGIGGNTTINATSGWIKASKYGGSVTIAEGKYMKDETGRYYKGTLTDAEKAAAAGKTLQPATQAEYINYMFGGGNGSQNSPYVISSTEGWNFFCDCLDDNNTWNRFSGKTVKLGADISVTRMAGSSQHDFCGTFDGNHKTLTFTSTENVDGVAPFSYISETTPTGGSEVSHPAIRNLNVVVNINTTATHASGLVGRQWGTLTIEDCTVSGTITTSAKYAAGFIGEMQGSANITDCLSSVTINSSVEGDGTHGGFVAATSHTLNIEGCLFNGSLLGESTHSCGGFVGWRNGTVNISNSLFAPAEVTIGVGTDYPSATFSRNGVSNITNCYYTDAFGTVQGKLRHSITAGANTTVANAGTATTYDVSGITSYGTGILYGGVLYAGNGDAVSLTLAHQEFEGYDFIGYTATAGNLNGSTLTMPDGNVTINAEYTCTAPSELTATDITFTTATLNWNGFQESYSVRYRTVGANEWQTIGGIAATTTTLSGLLSGTTYEWQVQGLDCDGNGGTTEWSATATFNTLSPCEVAPSELTATDITFTTATLNWNGLQESYSVRYRTVGANEWQTIGGIAATTTTLSGLLSGTTYEWQVQGLDCDGNGGTTEWSESGTFTTLNPCETPYNLTATDITATTATLSWSGVQDSYNVRYRELTLGDEVTATEGFEHDGDMPEGWTMLDQGNVPDNADELGISDDAAQNGTYGFRFSSYFGDEYDSFDQYLISPELNNLTAFSFYYRAEFSGKEETFRVGYSTTTNDVSAFTWVSNMTASSDAFSRFDANNIPAHAKYFAINYTAIYLYYLYIDDITYTYTPLVPVEWDEANTNVTNPITITGLTPETQYQWQVQGFNCNGEGSTTEWSEMGTFTTLAGIDLTVAGYEEGNGGWVFIASPVAENIAPSEVHNLIATTEEDYDLYRFNQSDANGNEWQNWKAEGTDNYHFNLEPGKGYLYATKETRTLMFAGEYTLASGSVAVPLDYDENAQFAGWNLVGNPFTVGATSSQPYYRMNAEGTALNTSTESTAVAAMEGVFVQAAEDGDTVNFTAQTRGGEKSAVAALNITVIKGGVSTSSTTATTLDNAIIRFDGGQTLEKFSMRQGSTRIYLPQGGKDYAIANAEAQTGEIPVNFKATENGTYTLGFSSQEVSFSYLHLIDNLTGDDIDLLATPDYTFQAKTTDYASRFKLVFVCEDAMGDDGTFAFFNGSEWMISNEGRATLQVVDAMGRVLRSETINGNATINTNGLSAGVYMLRLINGENVSVQKIVVR